MKVNRERECEVVEHYQEDWFEGSIQEIRARLNQVEREYGQGAYIEYRWSGYEDCECYVIEKIYETDEEMKKRIAAEEKAFARQRQKEAESARKAEERKRQKVLAKKAKLERELAEISKQL